MSGPTRKSTPRTGLEDLVSQVFTQALQGAGAGAGPSGFPAGGGFPVPGGGGGYNPYGGGATGGGGGGGGGYNPYGGAGGNFPGGAAPPGGPAPSAGKGGSKTGGGPPTIQDIYTNLSLPGYKGPLTAPLNELQKGGADAAALGMRYLPSFANLGQDVTSGLKGFAGAKAAPDSLTSLLTNRPGSDILSLIGGGGAEVGQLGKLAGTGTEDFGGIIESLNAARKGSLSDTLRDTQERFSSSGLRQSTDLARALGDVSQRSDEGFLGLAAQILPELTKQRAGALTGAGQLRLGAGQLLQSGGLQAGDILGQLYQGQQGRGLSALQSIPGAAELFATLPGKVGQQGFDIGTSLRGQETQGLQSLYNEFLRTQGGFLAPILNFAAGAPQITGPGKGSQLLGAGTTIGTAGLA